MLELQVIKNIEFGELNLIIKDNQQYVDGIQVATILGYANPRDAINRHCKKEGVVIHDTGVVNGKRLDGSSVIQYISRKYINEGNIYRLIIKSKLPRARKFERWLMEEVLPSIRKRGTYMNEDILNKALENPEFLIEIVDNLKKEKEEKILAQRKADSLNNIITLNMPYTQLGKSIAVTNNTITIGQFAKVLSNKYTEVGRNRLFKWFRDNGYFISRGKDKNIPKQVYIKQGLFKVSEYVANTSEGKIVSTTPLITGKGQLYFIDKLNLEERFIIEKGELKDEIIYKYY